MSRLLGSVEPLPEASQVCSNAYVYRSAVHPSNLQGTASVSTDDECEGGTVSLDDRTRGCRQSRVTCLRLRPRGDWRPTQKSLPRKRVWRSLLTPRAPA